MLRPKKAVTILLLNNKKVLMQLRDNNPAISYPNYWSTPSGGIERRETPDNAVSRELLEETEYQLQNPLLLERLTLHDGRQEIDLYVFLEKYDGIQPIHCHEGQKMEFLDLNEILDKPIHPVMKELLIRVLQDENSD